MIALSTFRPLNDNAEYERNQLAAKASWELAFDWIIYLCQESDERLASPKTVFIKIEEDYPTVQQMVEVASTQKGWVAILNADIVIGPMFKTVEDRLNRSGALAAFSRRYEFKPGDDVKRSKVVDLGLDFFAAVKSVWEVASLTVQPAFRMGHQQWDTWMLGFLNHHCGSRLKNITNQKVVFHPKHEGRRFVYDTASQINQQDSMFGKVAWGTPL